MVGSIATNVVDGFTMVAGGDLIVSRTLTKGREPGFGAVVDLLNRADVTFGNMETNIIADASGEARKLNMAVPITSAYRS
ncbi:hypothetical protein [Rhizobium mongolense]